MSELINTQTGRNEFRRQLLTTVSALALIGNVYGAQDAKADGDTDRPTLWIELGGQLEQQTGQGDPYAPSFVANNLDSPAFKPVSPLHVEKPPLFSNGAEAGLTFEPAGTDWVFSASIRYGRSTGHKKFLQSHILTHTAHRTFAHRHYIYITPHSGYYGSLYVIKQTVHQTAPQTAAVLVTQSQSHAIIDFAVGRDVGVGMFGGASNFNAGVRFAQFASRTFGTINARQDKFLTFYNAYSQIHFHTQFPTALWRKAGEGNHIYRAAIQSRRDFHGVGPSVSWNASLPVFGEAQAGILSVDWGANAAVLFGRQRASGSHHTAGYYHLFTPPPSLHPTQYTKAGVFNRSKTIVVPNVGGFAGLSFNFTNAKVSAGYRGDFFFGAMDTGNDARKTKTVDFYGPFATISIGIGG